jgi:hypothetical protein
VETKADDSPYDLDRTGSQPPSSVERTVVTHDPALAFSSHVDTPRAPSGRGVVPKQNLMPPSANPTEDHLIEAKPRTHEPRTPPFASSPTANLRHKTRRHRRRFIRWVKKFRNPWSGFSLHDPKEGQKAIKQADDQGLCSRHATQESLARS